jgi:hypothetical protein
VPPLERAIGARDGVLDVGIVEIMIIAIMISMLDRWP